MLKKFLTRLVPILLFAAAVVWWRGADLRGELGGLRGPAADSPAGEEARAVMEAVRRRVVAFHEGEKASGAVVRLVYFHPADREPLAGHAERLERTMDDISAFYREGLEQRFGVKSGGLPLERKDGKLVIHVVKGKHEAAHYNHQSGGVTWEEVKKALAGTINPEREHVLVLYGLCRREPDGRYVFDAPYYGKIGSNQQQGLCHAADCEVLDPRLLTAGDQPMVFTEHYYPRMEMTLAKFNTWYLGGIAHELGHGLGFPHDNGGPGEARGVSLMGGGNLHYREQMWGGKQPSYLSLATALRLVAHPLVTQSDKARWQAADARIEGMKMTGKKGGLKISGRVVASVPPCAVIAAAWPGPKGADDHGAMTFCSAVGYDGSFTVELTNINAREWQLSLGCLLVNGAETRTTSTLRCDSQGVPITEGIEAERVVTAVERALMENPASAAKLLSDERIAAEPDPEVRRQLKLLRAMQSPAPEPVDLTTATAASVFLSDARWTSAKVGWGKVVRNRYYFNEGLWEGMLFKIGGQVFDKGLYAHSKSSFVFPLGGGWKTFSATVGLRDGAVPVGSAVFTVVGDGKELGRSKILRVGEKEALRVELGGVKELELRVDGGEGHTSNSWAVWVDPVVGK